MIKQVSRIHIPQCKGNTVSLWLESCSKKQVSRIHIPQWKRNTVFLWLMSIMIPVSHLGKLALKKAVLSNIQTKITGKMASNSTILNFFDDQRQVCNNVAEMFFDVWYNVSVLILFDVKAALRLTFVLRHQRQILFDVWDYKEFGTLTNDVGVLTRTIRKKEKPKYECLISLWLMKSIKN